MGKIIKKPITYFIKNFIKKSLLIEIDEKSNLDLIKFINLNTVFMVSDKDGKILSKDFEKLIENFAGKLDQKNSP